MMEKKKTAVEESIERAEIMLEAFKECLEGTISTSKKVKRKHRRRKYGGCK